MGMPSLYPFFGTAQREGLLPRPRFAPEARKPPWRESGFRIAGPDSSLATTLRSWSGWMCHPFAARPRDNELGAPRAVPPLSCLQPWAGSWELHHDPGVAAETDDALDRRRGKRRGFFLLLPLGGLRQSRNEDDA